MQNMVEVSCKFCSVSFRKQAKEVRARQKKGQVNFFCNKRCKAAHQTKEAVARVVGQRFGMLFVVEARVKACGRHNASYLLCRCDCGKTAEISLSNLLHGGRVRTCGCTRRRPLKLTPQRSVLNRRLSSYERGARERGLEWTLPREKFDELLLSPCFFCGASGAVRFPIRRSTNNTEAVEVNGIDRLDNRIGYTVENCVTCCKNCNQAKSDRSLADFYEWAGRVAARAKSTLVWVDGI